MTTRVTARWALLFALTAGCDKVEHLSLPSPTPEAELAFGVLYEGDSPAVVGSVVRRAAVYAGRYQLHGEGGLDARLYFVKQDDLHSAANATCATRASASDRLLCEERVAACADTPESCWSAVTTTDGCGALLALGPEVPVEVFASDGGRLSRVDGNRAAGVSLCGPPAELACPNRRAGYAVFSEGKLACIPEARQLDCDLTLDLAACGLPRLEATLDAQGQPTLLSDSQGCTAGPAGPAPGPFGAPADFTLTCGGRTYELFAQDLLLAEAQCPRRGPGAYETEEGTTGRITGALVVPQGDGRRLLMVGGGSDECATAGCSARGGSCSQACFDTCITQVLVGPCTRDGWPACIGVSEPDACQARCRAYCARPADDPGCRADAYGQALTTAAPDVPETDRFRADLDGDNTWLAGGQPTLAPLVGDWVGVATRRRVYTYAADDADRWTRKAFVTTTMEVSGVLAYEPNALAIYGVEGSNVQVAKLAVERSGGSALSQVGPAIPLPALTGADVAALGGRRGDWVFVADSQTQLAGAGPRVVQAASLESDVALPEVTLPGDVSAMIGLPGGDVLAAYVRDDGVAEVAVLVPGASQVDAVHPRPLFAGVRVTALALDPESCAASAPAACRIFLGMERAVAAQPALLGALLYDAADPAGLELQAGLRPMSQQTVSLLVPDAAGGQVFAVTGGRNVITPMLLVE